MESGKGNQRTVTVADYIYRAQYEDLPAEVIKQAKIVILDTIGVMIAASRQRAGKLATEFIQHAGERPESTIVGYDIKAPSISAAFSNAIMAHDIELDDSHGASLTHPAAVIIPTVLAMGEKENCTGKDLIIATTVAYDVECRISMALDPQRQYARNFHPSCVCGCFGATAVAGKMLNLNKSQLINALGLAGCQASGLLAWETEVGHMSKSFQTGIAARNGIVAALLASLGYSAPPAIFDGRYNLFDAFSGAHNFDELIEELGTRFEIMNTSLKLYSSCRHTHAPLDAFFGIMRENNLVFENIREVTVKVAPGAVPVIDNNELLSHNAQYVIAVAAIRGEVTPEHFIGITDDPKIMEFSKRVNVIPEPKFKERFPTRKSGIVKVVTKNGREFEQQVDDAKGDPRNPISQEEIEEKFITLAVRVLPEERAKKILKLISRLEELENAGALMCCCKLNRED